MAMERRKAAFRTNQGDQAMKFLGYVFATLATLAYTTILGGFTIQALWMWFVVPVFEVPSLSVAAAAGLSLAVASIMPLSNSPYDEKDLGEVLTFALVAVSIKSAMLLAVGWVVRMFI